jgi:hypothetical protein
MTVCTFPGRRIESFNSDHEPGRDSRSTRPKLKTHRKPPPDFERLECLTHSRQRPNGQDGRGTLSLTRRFRNRCTGRDTGMPHIRGFELIRVFHERADAPVYCHVRLAFTNLGSPTLDVLEMALDLGAAGLSAKARSRQRHCWLRSKRV